MKKPNASPSLVLTAATAADLMTQNPVSIGQNASLQEAIVFLTQRKFSAAPVIDEAGRPVGVLSRADILIHDREQVRSAPIHEYYEKTELTVAAEEAPPAGTPLGKAGETQVHEIMTPVVFSVSPDTAASKVVEDMLALKVHRLFVVDRDGVLIGIISAFDILRHLKREE